MWPLVHVSLATCEIIFSIMHTRMPPVGHAHSSAFEYDVTTKYNAYTSGNSSYRQWWMLFIYMWIAWLLLSTGVIVRVIRHWRSAVKDFSGAAVEDVNGAYVAENEHALEQLHPVTAPPEWQPQTDNLQLFVIEQDSAEWDKVEQYFKNTLPNADIQEICRIQNKWLWRRFINHKEQLCQKNQGISEKELFHGTRGNDPKLIYDSEVAFDMRFSAKGMWGQANYFAVNASYSDGYAFHKGNGLKEMFLVKVLIGETYECQPDSSLLLPPEKETIEMGPMKFSKTRYDTVTGTTGGSRVYMTYDNEKAYPAYLIKYKCS